MSGESSSKRWSSAPYGEPETTTGPAANDNETKGYIGETRDPETGLMYLNAIALGGVQANITYGQDGP